MEAHGFEARRRLGYVPEDVPLYPQMVVTEFLAFMAALKGLRGGAVRRGLDRVLEDLELGKVARVLIGRLSPGGVAETWCTTPGASRD